MASFVALYRPTVAEASIARTWVSAVTSSGPLRQTTTATFDRGVGCPIGTSTLIVSAAPIAAHEPGRSIRNRAVPPFIVIASPTLGSGWRIRVVIQFTNTPFGESDVRGQSHARPRASGGLGDALGAVAQAGSSGSVLR